MADDKMTLPPGYEDAKPVQAAKAAQVKLPPGYEDAKPVTQPSLGQVLIQPTEKTDKEYMGYTGPAGVAGATIHGLNKVAEDTQNIGKGLYHMVVDPASEEETTRDKANGAESESLLGRTGLVAERMVRGVINPLVEAAKDVPHIRSAVRDINTSPDPLTHYANAAEDTASQGAAQALTAIAAEKTPSAVKGASDVLRRGKELGLTGPEYTEGTPVKPTKPTAAPKVRMPYPEESTPTLIQEPDLVGNEHAEGTPAKPTGALMPKVRAPYTAPSDLAETLESTEKAVEPEIKAAKAGLKPISTEAEPGLVSNAYIEPKAAAVEKAVEGPGFKKLVDQIGEQVRQATGGAKLQPDVSLREQLIPDKPVAEEPTVEPEKKLSSRPDKAMLQKSGATDAEMEKILPLTRVELSKLANHFDVDLGESAIGRGKGDIKAGTHIPREAVLQKIVDAGYSTADIAKAVDNGEHLPKASGGSQMLDAMKQAEEAGPSWTTDKAGDVVEKLNKNPKVTINVRGSVGEKGASANDLDLHFQKGSSADVKAELEDMGFKLSHKTNHGSVFTNGKTGQAIDTWESVEPKRNR